MDVTFQKRIPYYKYLGSEFTFPVPQTSHSTINFIHFLESEVSSEAQFNIKIDNTLILEYDLTNNQGFRTGSQELKVCKRKDNIERMIIV